MRLFVFFDMAEETVVHAITLTTMERLGIVGLPNAGKSALFNALTGGNALVASHPFSTTETNVGIARVADGRLDALAEMSKSKKVVHATVELVDIAGLVAGAASGEGLGNRFLAGIREVDAVILVLRAFESDEIVGGHDPLDDLHTLELELVRADVASVEGLLYRPRKAAKNDKDAAAEVPVLEAALDVLNTGMPIYRSSLTAEQRVALRPSFLLTNKPVLAVVNLGDDQITDALVLADLATIGVLGSKTTTRPHDGSLDWGTEDLGGRHAAVHQATGMLMIQLDVTIEEAFVRLRAYAFATDRRLPDVAADVVAHRLRIE